MERMRLFLRATVVLLVAAVLGILGGGVHGWWRLRGSLPGLDGTRAVAGLAAPVTVERDALGIPTITGASRSDVAYALGFVHAQDRFFQMDLQRRQPAGELSALVGARAVEADTRMRRHRFRDVARRAVVRTDAHWRVVLDAYARGVNAGLSSLASPPFEYALLGATPEPWVAEDSLLTVLAMVDRLQGRQLEFEQTNQQLRDAVPDALYRFLTQAGSDWDAPAQGTGRP
jgi:penicillin amidase